MATLSLMDSLPDLAKRIDRSKTILLGLDFDGTLTPICSQPGEVALADSVRGVLAHLASLTRVTVMIVSGRSLSDLSDRVGLPKLIYAGNHGLEILGRGLAFVEPTAAALAGRLEVLTTRLMERLKDVPGALVEPKKLTTSVHYRNVPVNRYEALEEVVRDVVASDLDHFVVTEGARVWEVRPLVSWHKGYAINWVLQWLNDRTDRLVFYFGDDRTDEDAFASLPDDITVKVGQATSSSLARYHLADPAAVEGFLNWIAETLSPKLGRIVS